MLSRLPLGNRAKSCGWTQEKDHTQLAVSSRLGLTLGRFRRPAMRMRFTRVMVDLVDADARERH